MSGKSCVVIIGGGADIGRALAERYIAAGRAVVLTYRHKASIADLLARADVIGVECDVSDPDSGGAIAGTLSAKGWQWDRMLSCVGTMKPISPFFATDFGVWEKSLGVNAVGQLRALHALYPHRVTGSECGVMFMAGGGTNNPFTNYSAYAASKILLIKMAELIDDEAPDLNVFVIGPGFVHTKIHAETLDNATHAGANLEKTRAFLKTTGTSYDEIFECVEWCLSQGRRVAGGRNFSVVHDAWREGGSALAAELLADSDLFKLRRRGTAKRP